MSFSVKSLTGTEDCILFTGVSVLSLLCLLCSYPETLQTVFLQKRTLQQARKFAAEVGFGVGHCAGSKVLFLGGILSWVGGSTLQRNSLPVQLSCALEQMCLRACSPPWPSPVSGGLRNRSSAYSAPHYACAMKKVGCLSPTCAHCSILIRDDNKDGISKRQGRV